MAQGVGREVHFLERDQEASVKLLKPIQWYCAVNLAKFNRNRLFKRNIIWGLTNYPGYISTCDVKSYLLNIDVLVYMEEGWGSIWREAVVSNGITS